MARPNQTTPLPGEFVAIIFRNGVRLEGEVLYWSDGKSSILTGTTTTIIHKTLDDVLYTHIIEAKIKQEIIKSKPVKPEDVADLVELKKELLSLEKEEISAKLQDHTISNIKQFNYELPKQFHAIKNPIQHPRKETSREDTGIGAELQNMFGQKHSED